MRGCNFYFDSVDLLYYQLQKTSLSRKGSSYIDSPERLKNKKATINHKSGDDKCFQNSVAAALNLEQIKGHPEKMSSIKPSINQYNWKEINFPSHKKRFEQV